MSIHDQRLMHLALALGLRQNGLAWPNPAVGAVLIQQNGDGVEIVGQGVTQFGGRPHAEPIAIAAAGEAARGSTLYVSLEPCAHHGKTPPCADAIVAAGVARVVAALEDPDPRVTGQGMGRLLAAGLEVTTGLMADEARRAHRGHLTRIRLGRPAVTVKLARTADGFASGVGSEPRIMISGEGAWARTHGLRAHADAIAVGISTVLRDDPRLDVRLPGLEERAPVRIVFDSRLRCPPGSVLAGTARTRPTWVVCGEGADRDAERTLTALGIDVIRVAEDATGRLRLADALTSLAQRGLTRLFCEGGPTLAAALAEADAVDELWIMTSARRLDRPGLAAIGGHLQDALVAMRRVSVETVGSDTVEHFERHPCSPVS